MCDKAHRGKCIYGQPVPIVTSVPHAESPARPQPTFILVCLYYCCNNAFSPPFYNAQVSIKRFLKRNLAHVGMVQCMNALADKVHKQEVPCTQ